MSSGADKPLMFDRQGLKASLLASVDNDSGALQAALSRLLSDYRVSIERDCEVFFDTYASGSISFDDLCIEIVGLRNSSFHKSANYQRFVDCLQAMTPADFEHHATSVSRQPSVPVKISPSHWQASVEYQEKQDVVQDDAAWYMSKPWLTGLLSLDGDSLCIRGRNGHTFKVSVSQLHCIAHHPLDTAISFKSAAFQYCVEPDALDASSSSALTSSSSSSSSSLSSSSSSSPVSTHDAMINVDFASTQAVEQWSYIICNSQESHRQPQRQQLTRMSSFQGGLPSRLRSISVIDILYTIYDPRGASWISELKVVPDLSKEAGTKQFMKVLQQELVRRYSSNPKEIEFYFLQLITLCFTKKDESTLQLLQSLLFHCCKCSIHSALLAIFMAEGAIFKPVVGDPKSVMPPELIPDLKRVQEIKSHIVVHIFNCASTGWSKFSEEQIDGETLKMMIARTSTTPFFLPVFKPLISPVAPKGASGAPSSPSSAAPPLASDIYADRCKERIKMMNSMQDFINNLTKISADLCTVERKDSSDPKRTDRLRTELAEINKMVMTSRMKDGVCKMHDGLYLPTKFSGDDVMFICQLPPEEARDMSTFNKVPYWLVVEYVSVRDGLSDAAVAERHAAIKAIREVRDSRAKTMSDAEDDGFEVVEGWGGDGKRSSQSEKKKPQRAFSETISRGSSNFKDELELIRQLRCEVDSSTRASIILEDEEEPTEPRSPRSPPGSVDISLAVQEHMRLTAGGGETVSRGSVSSNPENIKVLDSVFGLPFEVKRNQRRQLSPYSSIPGWGLCTFIVKANDDLRQEQFAMQLIMQLIDIWDKAGLMTSTIVPYRILATEPTAGLIEVVADSVPLKVITKKYPDSKMPISDFFVKAFGPVGSASFKVAQQNFVGSMAAYSMICFLLQIKDRHDGNILLKRDGSIVHIDFGWMLGKVMPMNIEASAPFKLTADMAAVMRCGSNTLGYQMFVGYVKAYYDAARRPEALSSLCNSIRVTQLSSSNPLGCIDGGERFVRTFRDRFNEGMTDQESSRFIESLISTAEQNFSMRMYDGVQKLLGTQD